MTTNQIQSHLDNWRGAMRGVDHRINALMSVVGCSPDSPLITAIHELQDAMTHQLSCLIGWEAWIDVLADWHLVHDFGEKPMRITLNDEKLRTLSSNADLAAFIVEDLERGEQS